MRDKIVTKKERAMKKHTAKKICRGNYIYRGHEILKIDCYSGKPFWNVFTKEVCKHTGIETPYCGDATNTLADAKDMIDAMIEMGTSNDEGHSLVIYKWR